MTYTADKPQTAPSSDALRARIPGWGVDRDPADRPAVPREQATPELIHPHWDFPERQAQDWPRERSLEHEFVTPVFGTTCPPHGLSGAVRRLAYRRYSEARAAHWLLLLLGDRIDATGSHLRSFATLRPDNPITETGVLSELRHHGIRSRFATKRADRVHQALDPIVVGGPWLVAGATGILLARRVRRRRGTRRV